jgi:hypothetical protein
MNGPGIIRTVYLYLFALLGLVLATIGAVRLADMTLRQTLFPQADEEQRYYARQPPMPPIRVPERHAGAEGDSITLDERALTPEERAALRQWTAEYEDWRERSRQFDPVASRRARDASTSIAFLGVGIPLYLFHWRLIRRDAAARATA